MTKYKLEDLKKWLEEKPERKAGLDWSKFFPGVVNSSESLLPSPRENRSKLTIPHFLE